jgi:hypothetical protein
MQVLKQVACLVNLQEPDEVKKWLANLIETKPCKWKDKTKVKFCYAYTDYLTFRGMTWKKPKYKIVEKSPFIPTEQEIDLLIAGCGKTTATVLQTLKETAIRIGELANQMDRHRLFQKNRIGHAREGKQWKNPSIKRERLEKDKRVSENSWRKRFPATKKDAKRVLQRPAKGDCRATPEPKTVKNHVQHVPTLESNNDVPRPT